MHEQLELIAISRARSALGAYPLAVTAEWIPCPRGGSCDNQKCVNAGGCDKLSVDPELPQAGMPESAAMPLTEFDILRNTVAAEMANAA